MADVTRFAQTSVSLRLWGVVGGLAVISEGVSRAGADRGRIEAEMMERIEQRSEGEKLQELMEEEGLTQRELAERAGVDD